MNKYLIFIPVVLIILISVSCSSPDKKKIHGNTKQYEKRQANHSGKAVITEILPSKNDQAGDNSDYMNIYFKFIPSAPGAKEKYLCASCPDSNVKIFYDNRESFHKNWILKWEIKPGKEYSAIRHEYSRENGKTSVTYEVFLEPGR